MERKTDKHVDLHAFFQKRPWIYTSVNFLYQRIRFLLRWILVLFIMMGMGLMEAQNQEENAEIIADLASSAPDFGTRIVLSIGVCLCFIEVLWHIRYIREGISFGFLCLSTLTQLVLLSPEFHLVTHFLHNPTDIFLLGTVLFFFFALRWTIAELAATTVVCDEIHGKALCTELKGRRQIP